MSPSSILRCNMLVQCVSVSFCLSVGCRERLAMSRRRRCVRKALPLALDTHFSNDFNDCDTTPFLFPFLSVLNISHIHITSLCPYHILPLYLCLHDATPFSPLVL